MRPLEEIIEEGRLDVQVDELDKQILRTLYDDVRASYKSIADRLGVSHNTVKARMDRMLDDEVFKFAIVTDPPKVGLAATAYLIISADPRHIDSISKTLAGRHEVSFLGLMLGDGDILALAHFSGNDSLFRFVNGFVGHLAGVTSVKTILMCDTIKGLPDRNVSLLDAAANDSEGTRTVPRAV